MLRCEIHRNAPLLDRAARAARYGASEPLCTVRRHKLFTVRSVVGSYGASQAAREGLLEAAVVLLDHLVHTLRLLISALEINRFPKMEAGWGPFDCAALSNSAADGLRGRADRIPEGRAHRRTSAVNQRSSEVIREGRAHRRSSSVNQRSSEPTRAHQRSLEPIGDHQLSSEQISVHQVQSVLISVREHGERVEVSLATAPLCRLLGDHPEHLDRLRVERRDCG